MGPSILLAMPRQLSTDFSQKETTPNYLQVRPQDCVLMLSFVWRRAPASPPPLNNLPAPEGLLAALAARFAGAASSPRLAPPDDCPAAQPAAPAHLRVPAAPAEHAAVAGLLPSARAAPF